MLILRYILEIFKEAKEGLIIIDSYADETILNIIKNLDNKNKVTIISTGKYLTGEIIKKYNEQYGNLKVIYNDTFHNRYFILDSRIVYHCGASINRIGYKTFSITRVNDDEIVKALLGGISKI